MIVLLSAVYSAFELAACDISHSTKEVVLLAWWDFKTKPQDTSLRPNCPVKAKAKEPTAQANLTLNTPN